MTVRFFPVGEEPEGLHTGDGGFLIHNGENWVRTSLEGEVEVVKTTARSWQPLHALRDYFESPAWRGWFLTEEQRSQIEDLTTQLDCAPSYKAHPSRTEVTVLFQVSKNSTAYLFPSGRASRMNPLGRNKAIKDL